MKNRLCVTLSATAGAVSSNGSTATMQAAIRMRPAHRLVPRRVNVLPLHGFFMPRGENCQSVSIAPGDHVDTHIDAARRLLVVDDEPVQCLIVTRAMAT